MSKPERGFAAPIDVPDETPDPARLKEFVGGAKVATRKSVAREPEAQEGRGGKTKQFPIRFESDDELEPLRWLAEKEDRSMQYMARKLFLAAILEEARKQGYKG